MTNCDLRTRQDWLGSSQGERTHFWRRMEATILFSTYVENHFLPSSYAPALAGVDNQTPCICNFCSVRLCDQKNVLDLGYEIWWNIVLRCYLLLCIFRPCYVQLGKKLIFLRLAVSKIQSWKPTILLLWSTVVANEVWNVWPNRYLSHSDVRPR